MKIIVLTMCCLVICLWAVIWCPGFKVGTLFRIAMSVLAIFGTVMVIHIVKMEFFG